MSLRLRPLLTAVAALLALALAVPAGATSGLTDLGLLADAGDACARGSAAAAASSLVADDADLLAVDADGALVSEPILFPGMRHRLIQLDAGVWCTASAINLVQAGLGTVAQAEGAARVLAAANFDGVTILDSAEVAPGIVELTTHARTNGIVADWTIAVDALGIREATWTATNFAVAPFDAEYEGLTALPGATDTFVRDAAGFVHTTSPLLADPSAFATGDGAAPGAQMVNEMSDGFTIYVNIGDTGWNAGHSGAFGVAPDPDVDSGDDQVDYLRIMSEAANVNYEDYLKWGLTQEAGAGAVAPGWTSDEGTIHVDGAWAAYCLACVFISEDYNVHMSRALHEALAALGYSYPDDRLAVINIVGHEMIHNFQNAYGKPDSIGGGRARAYSEGVARFAESLHDYSHVSHQSGSLIYAADSNGCNGFNTTDAGFRNGPLDGLGYHACQFWFAHYAEYGVESVVGILENSAGLGTGSEYQIYAGAIAAGSDDSMTNILANFAARAISHEGYVWGNPVNPESGQFDWTTPGLERWTPSSSVAAGSTFGATLGRGGLAAAEVTAPLTIAAITGGAAAVANADGSYRVLAAGDLVSGGHLVLINPSANPGTDVSVATL